MQLTNDEYTRLLEIAGHEVKIGGKTMKDYLDAFVQTPTYKNMKGEGPDSPQMATLRSLANKFDAVAVIKLKQENKDLTADIKQYADEHRAKRYGLPQPGGTQ